MQMDVKGCNIAPTKSTKLRKERSKMLEAFAPTSALAHPIDNQTDRSLEEKDHLVRSTKKIKNLSESTADQVMNDSIETIIEDQTIVDQGMNDSTQNMTEDQTKKSFKQALTSSKTNEKAFDIDLERLSDDDLLTDEEDNEDIEEADPSQIVGLGPHIPKIKLPSRLIKRIRKPWKDCLIVRLLGKMQGYKFLVSKLSKIWGLQGDFEATDLGLGFFLIKFEMRSDCSRVYTEGLWIIMDHY
ncbi:hypothetical protein LOK49_LG13G01235 [Camellia lanceoleosa]|uniref:Uncharacterized protein n=1 Tax=Camellia lanceoleosa TaxID=1840588 RepID=A0ACC0FHC6_9ERIC|nr:hypothetical protein LOK49_LG13G01235 [Camellia lanceoleosa]